MTLTSSGQISMGDIRTELGDSGSISLKEASDGTIATINTNNASADRPDGSAPHAMTEFYSYNHTEASIAGWMVDDFQGTPTSTRANFNSTTLGDSLTAGDASGDAAGKDGNDDIKEDDDDTHCS